MSRYLPVLAALLATLTLACSSTKTEVADTVYRNGRIYTVDAKTSWAEAVAIKDGAFLVVGSNDEAKAVTGPGTEVIDLNGKFVMPGIVDLHVHPWATPTYNTLYIDFGDPYNTERMVEQIATYAKDNPGEGWIRGGSWGVGHFPGNAPSKELLDAVVPDRPIVLIDQTGHNFWVNSKALELANIDADTPSPEGYVVKDPTTGEPTGTLREDAIRAVEQVADWPTAAQYYPALRDIFLEFNSYGVTSMRTAEGTTQWLDVTKAMEEAGDLDMRLFVAWDWHMHITTPYTNEEMDAQIADRAKYASDLVKPDFVKIFLDGTPDGYEVSFIEPYSDGSGEHGKNKFTTAELTDVIANFDAQGVGMFMHSVGEGGTRSALDAIEAVRERNGDSGVRHSIAHLIWVHADDLDRFAQIPGVTASVSPAVSYPDSPFHAYEPLVGKERLDRMFPAGDLVRAGARPGYGTDWLTVLAPNPWPIMQNLVTRKNAEHPEMGQLGEGHNLTVAEAIRMFTANGAYAVMAEDRIGSIEAGKQADMIVLDRNPLEIEPVTLNETKPLKTLLGGRVVYDASKQTAPDVIDESEYYEAGRVVH
jgi:predicted amidohydrolase YtcJ